MRHDVDAATVLIHVYVPWKAVYHAETESWCVATDDGDDEPSFICSVEKYLPGCLTGEATAKAIAAMHNTMLILTGGEGGVG